MTRKHQNPLKIGPGEYRYYPKEIELMGKIPDGSVAKIFRTTYGLIKKGRENLGIPKSSIRSKKQIKEVLQSLNAPWEYFSLLGLADLTPRQQLHKERAEQREREKRKELAEKKRERKAKKRKELAEKKRERKAKKSLKPKEVKLLGKIPDTMVAKIAGKMPYEIASQRKDRGIAPSKLRSHDHIRSVLYSIDAPQSYFKILGITPDPLQPKKKEAFKPKQMEPLQEISVAALPHQRVKTSALPGQWGKSKSKSVKPITSSRKSDLELLRDRTPVDPYTEYDKNIDDFFEPESAFDRKRRLAVQDTMPIQGYPITKPLKNPRSVFASIDQVLGAQVDQFQEDLLYNPWSAYFKFLGFAVGATAISYAAVKAVSSLLGKSK